MSNMSQDVILPSKKGKGRKKIADKSKWKREISKRERYSSPNLPCFPICKHNGKTFHCKKLTGLDIYNFHRNFYLHKNKVEQDAFILKYCSHDKPKRQNRNLKEGSSRKSVAIKYFVKKCRYEKYKIQVCQQTFLQILHVSKDRVQRICRNHLNTGLMPKENRGGDRISTKFVEKRIAVKRFIENLKCVESHYCRSKTDSRQYLPSGLSISKLWRTYNSNVNSEHHVKRTFFQKIFTNDYNIGFGTPVTDACSKCIELSERIKQEMRPNEKNKLIIEKRVHKLKATAFFKKLQEKKNELITFSFDCQKNLVIPKIPDQIAYFSRQLYIYNFTIVRGSSKSHMNPENVFIYTWMEHEYKKSSNEISSAVFHCLSQVDLSPYSNIRLCADGCGGQNRNSTMIGMCSYFLANVAPPNVKTIELIFPVPGHSYLPSDRIFGRIEKILKKESTIIDPKIYRNIFEEHGTVVQLGKDCEVKDWKLSVKEFLKPVQAWHFKFSQAKRFILSKSQRNLILVSGEVYYNSDTGTAKSLLKRGKTFSYFSPNQIEMRVDLNQKKVGNVRELLRKHFGDRWMERQDLSFLYL
nr:uncharacterized protein LOC111419015 [Onthophagus taurus]